MTLMKPGLFNLLPLVGMGLFVNVVCGQEHGGVASAENVPTGGKVIFSDDVSKGNIGDSPTQWLTSASAEIVAIKEFSGLWLQMTKGGYCIPKASEAFTDNFIIEFDFVPMNTINSKTMTGLSFYLVTGSLSEPGGGGEPGDAGFQMYLDSDNLGWKSWSLKAETRESGSIVYSFNSSEKYHIAICAQKQRVRLFANGDKVLDVPHAIPAGDKPNIFRFDTREEATLTISKFRIATGISDRAASAGLKSATKPAEVKANTAIQGASVSAGVKEQKNYKFVKIGTQTWMIENLNVSRFRNGDPVPEAKTSEEWIKAAPAWCCYENDPKNEAKYGKLYNWYAMTDSRGLAPEGWHIPDGAEWKKLSETLGGMAAAGRKMKNASGWDDKGNGNNESQFSGMPGGFRHNEGTFLNLGSMGFWWSASATVSAGSLSHTLNNANNYFGWGEGKVRDFYGFSIRCVKD